MKHNDSAKPRASAPTVATLKRRLEREVTRRIRADMALVDCKRQHADLLAESRSMQIQLRNLSHGILSTQEEERKRISRELHDQIGQALAGINIHLSALKAKDIMKAREIGRKIEQTRRLVEKTVDIVHRFASELRPTALDDLGLIPSLHSYLKDFGSRTHIRVRFKASPRVKEVGSLKSTVLFRVAQEALTNVARHAEAANVSIALTRSRSGVEMRISDDGKSFQVERKLRSRRNKRLGLIGMRERIEMVHGTFSIDSAPGSGTTIHAGIPIETNPAPRKNK